jgi:molybdopterin synthase sulfur carrier subunit
MTLKVIYFGLLAELTGCSEEQFEFNGQTVSELLSELYVNYPQLRGCSFKVAADNMLLTSNSKIETTTLALLPPFSGG